MSFITRTGSFDITSDSCTAIAGRITKIKTSHAKANGKNNIKQQCVDVIVNAATIFENVQFYGGGVDHSTNNPHGLFVPPRENQMVLVLCINGNSQAPVACIPLPYSMNNKDEILRKYNDIIVDKSKQATVDEIQLCHYSGMKIAFRDDGSLDIRMQDKNKGESFDKTYFLNVAVDKNTGNFTIIDSNTTPNKVEFKTTGLKVTDKNSNIVEMTSSGMKLTDCKSGTPNTIEMNSTGVHINGTALEVS